MTYTPQVGDKVTITIKDAVLTDVRTDTYNDSAEPDGHQLQFSHDSVCLQGRSHVFWAEDVDSVVLEGPPPPPKPSYIIGDIVERDNGGSVAVKIGDNQWRITYLDGYNSSDTGVHSDLVTLGPVSRDIRRNGEYV